MNKQIDRFGAAFDYLDSDKRDIETLTRINTLIHHSRSNAPFYTKRLPAEALNSLAEFSDIPILSQQDLRDHLPPNNQGILTRSLADAYVFTSGGTTGDPKFTFYSNEEMKIQAHLCGKGFYLPGIRSGFRVANMMNAGNLWASFTFVNKALELCDCLIFPIAAQTGVEVSVNYMRLFNINAAIGIPSFFISLANYCEEQNITDINLEIIATGGERIYPETKAYISRILGVEKFVSAGYSSNDTGLIGFNCEKQKGSVHHLHEKSVFVEIVDPVTGKPVENGNPGKIIVTCLSRFLMPLIRYDIGDMGCILSDTCGCGRKVKLLELQGRSDETLIIGGYNISPSVITQLISHFPELSYHFQISAGSQGVKDILGIQIESKGNMTDLERRDLEEQFLAFLMQEENALNFLVESKGMHLPEVQVFNPGTLPRNQKTGKIRQVIDKRQG